MPKQEKPQVTRTSFLKARSVFRYIKPYRVPYAFSFLFLLLTSITTMLFPLLMGKMIGAGQTTQSFNLLDTSNINAIVVLLFIVFAAQSVFSFLRIYFGNIVVEGAMRDLRTAVYQRLVTMPMDFYNANKVGELTSRINSDVQLLQETLSITITEFIRQSIIVLIGISILAFTSFKLSLIMLATIPVVAIVAVVFGRFIKKLSKEVQDRVAESNQVVDESLTGIVNVKSFANEVTEVLRYKNHIHKVHQLSMKNAVWRGAFVSFIIFFMFGAITFLGWQGVTMVNNKEITGEQLASFIMTTVLLGISFGSLPELYTNIQRAIGGTEKLMDLLTLDVEKIDLKAVKSNEKVLNGEIEFNHVDFSYSTRTDIEVLKDVSFTLKPGQHIALVGSSGSGKSTIVSLILQLYHNYTGTILYDGKKASAYDLTVLRNQMALVPQEVILFSGTIRENIAYGKPNATHAEIKQAAAQANALDFINGFPDGFDTLVGDRGIQLSGGQKQRIAIARAVLKNPVILLLDEATSSLDSESERIVQDALDKLMHGRTTVVVAHRLSTIRNADQIFVFEKGHKVEQGNHQELMQLNGRYAQLYNMQSQDLTIPKTSL